MNGKERREQIIHILKSSNAPISGTRLADMLHVSRQVIVQDIALLREKEIIILPTSRGYILPQQNSHSRIFKVFHTDQDVEKELNIIVDMGGWVKDVFVYHKVYGVIKAGLNIHSRRDIAAFLEELKQGKSTLLMNVTSGYHYHTVVADSDEILECIHDELKRQGFLASPKEFEPADFT